MVNIIRKRISTFTKAIQIWHIILALICLASIVILIASSVRGSFSWLTAVAIALLVAEATVSIIAIPYLVKQKSRGRVLSVAVNYIAFVFTLIAALHTSGALLSIDTIARTFGNGFFVFIAAFFYYFILNSIQNKLKDSKSQKIMSLVIKIGLLILTVIFLLLINFIPWFFAVLLGMFTFPSVFFTVVAIITGFISWMLVQQPMGEHFNTSLTTNDAINGYLFLSPNLLGFLIFFAAPLVLSLVVSFTNWDALGTQDFIGFENYRRIFSIIIQPLQTLDQPVAQALDVSIYDELSRFSFFGSHFIIGAEDKLFWIALGNTLVFCLMAVPLSVGIGLILANVLNQKIPGMKFFRALYFIPSIAAVVGISLIWQWLYNAAFGYINYFITSFVEFGNSLGFSWVDPKTQWLSDGDTALFAIVIMSVWQTMGFNTVLFLAGLQTIPKELYEAGTIDGAGPLYKFRHITLPMLAPTTFFVISTTTIQALQVFEQVYIATNPPGGPNNATLTMVLYLYQNGFQRFKQGYASATAWVLFLVIFLVTMLQYRRQKANESMYN